MLNSSNITKKVKKIATINTLYDMKNYEIILSVLFLLYLLSGVSTPYGISPYVNNIFTQASLLALVFIFYLYGNPLFSLFSLFVILVFIHRSKKVDYMLLDNTVKNKRKKMETFNKDLNKVSLEEEIVGNIVKTVDNMPNPSNYKPVLCDNKNASEI